MNKEQPAADPALDAVLEKAKKESKEKEFNPEAERERIYARANERRQKLFDFRREVFKKAGEAIEDERRRSSLPEGHGYVNPPEYQAFSDAHSRALEKTSFGHKEGDEVQLTPDEKAALAYQIKYNEIQRDMELAIEELEKRIRESQPEQPKPKEPKIEEPRPKVEDWEKRMSEI